MVRVLGIGSQWVKNSPKILDLTKNDAFQVYIFQNDEKVG